MQFSVLAISWQNSQNFIPDNIKLEISIIIFLRLLQRLEGGWSERGQRHRPRGGGGVQCHQAGGSLVQADQVVGPERSGAIWVSVSNLCHLSTLHCTVKLIEPQLSLHRTRLESL